MKIRIGERFGKLTVVSKDENKDKGGCIKWICKCDCGNIVSVRSGYLRNGTTKSCGCIRRKVKDISGEKFGRLTVLDFHHKYTGQNSHATYWHCKCDCGKEVVVSQGNLHSGKVRSCGCMNVDRRKEANTTHGKSKTTRIYTIWAGMKDRCCNPKNNSYRYYGGKGVFVCPEWSNDFLLFYNWSMKNGYNDNMSIDRIDSSKNYEPSNCRWITCNENSARTCRTIFITVDNSCLSINDWASRIKVSDTTLTSRYKEFGKEWLEESIGKVLESHDNSILYKNKRYASSI